MKRFAIILSVIFLFSGFLSTGNASAAVMSDYCQIPPYVIQNVPSNIMIVLDNSGSMYGFSYYDGMYTTSAADDKICDIGAGDEYPCTCTGDPCTDFTVGGTKVYPTYKYYGYFNPDYWYTYGSSKFTPTAPKTDSGITGARAKNAAEWDGNFLNWLTMRRLDIIRKVMTGGKTTGTGANTRAFGDDS